MNNIEFKALVKGLGLSQRQVQEIGRYKDARQIRRFYAGDQPPHADVVGALQQLDKKVDSIVDACVLEALEAGAICVNIVGYTDKQYSERTHKGLLYSALYLCMLFRLTKALDKLAIKLNIVPFNCVSFDEFVKKEGIESDEAAIAKWVNLKKG